MYHQRRKALAIVLLATFLSYCSGGGRTCVPAGTMISTPDGAVAIETLEVGDAVSSYNFETQQVVTGKVVATYRHNHHEQLIDIELANGTAIEATEEHQFYDQTQEKWVAAAQLTAGTILLQQNDEGKAVAVTIANIETAPLREVVYNINVRGPEEISAWFAEGILTQYY